MDAEVDDVHSALHWTFTDGDPTLGRALALATAPYWAARAQGHEGLRWIVDCALHHSTTASDRTHALYAQAQLRLAIEDFHAARDSALAAADPANTLNDPHHAAAALVVAGRCERMIDNAAAVRRHHAEQALSLVRALPDELLEADALRILGTTLASLAREQRGRPLARERGSSRARREPSSLLGG